MPAGVYNIHAEQGANFSLHLRYSDSAGDYINMQDFDTRMQVRKSPSKSKVVLHLTQLGVTGGGSTGEFEIGSGVAGESTYGIARNASVTGGTGHTGGLLITIDPTTMKNCPHGNHFYDIELENISTGTVTRLLQGRFTVEREVTR